MPKRPLDITSPVPMSAERAARKTERSHEENQERAYIAASRRADRSIEARVQSARMASEIHKKRTGKGFKITEEIVMKEEMYEEEEDDLPRQYRALAAHLQTSSADMNSRLSAYLTNQVAMASLARQQEVNRMFAEQFPNASQVSQNIAQSMYLQPLQQQQQSQQHGQSPQSPMSTPSPSSPQFQQMSYGDSMQASQRERAASFAYSMDAGASPRASFMSAPSLSPPRHDSIDISVSPPMLTPGSTDTETPVSQQSMSNHHYVAPLAATSADTIAMTMPVDPSLSTMSTTMSQLPMSSFTTELPAEAKQMVNLDFNDPLAYGFIGGELNQTDQFGNLMDLPATSDPGSMIGSMAVKAEDHHLFGSAPGDYVNSSINTAPRLFDISGQHSTIGTPGGGDGDLWDTWVNTDQWSQLEADEH